MKTPKIKNYGGSKRVYRTWRPSALGTVITEGSQVSEVKWDSGDSKSFEPNDNLIEVKMNGMKDYVRDYNELVAEAISLGYTNEGPIHTFHDEAIAQRELRSLGEMVEAIKHFGYETAMAEKGKAKAAAFARNAKLYADQQNEKTNQSGQRSVQPITDPIKKSNIAGSPKPRSNLRPPEAVSAPIGKAKGVVSASRKAVEAPPPAGRSKPDQSNLRPSAGRSKPDQSNLRPSAGRSKPDQSNLRPPQAVGGSIGKSKVYQSDLDTILGSRQGTLKGRLLTLLLRNRGKKLALTQVAQELYGDADKSSLSALNIRIKDLAQSIERAKATFSLVQKGDTISIIDIIRSNKK